MIGRVSSIMALTLVAIVTVLSVNGCKKKEPAREEMSTMPANHEHSTMNGMEAGGAGSTEMNMTSGEQTICPVMGGKIDKAIYTEYKGKKVYFCCSECLDKFKADPEKYISKLPQFAE